MTTLSTLTPSSRVLASIGNIVTGEFIGYTLDADSLTLPATGVAVLSRERTGA